MYSTENCFQEKLERAAVNGLNLSDISWKISETIVVTIMSETSIIRPFNNVVMEIDGFNIPNHMVPWILVLFFSFEVLLLQIMFFVVHYFNCSRRYTQVWSRLRSAPVAMNDYCCSITPLWSAIQGKKWWLFPSQWWFFWAQQETLSIARPPDAPLPLIQLWIAPKCSLAAEWLNECTVKSPLVAASHNFCSPNNRHWRCCLIRHHPFFHCSVVRLWSTVTCGHISKHAFATVKALGING